MTMSSSTGVPHRLIWTAITVALAGCAEPLPVDEIEGVEQAEEALTISLSPDAIAYDYAARSSMPHGVAGDTRLVFTAEPLNGRVVALDRLTGAEVGTFPPPARGWILPFSMRMTPSGTVVVLDPGGFPAPGVITEAQVHEYAYVWDAWRRTFTATLIQTVSLGGLPIVFTEDIEVTDDNLWIVTEAGIGAIWVIDDGIVMPGVLPASFGPFDLIPALTGCGWPDGVVVDGIPFTLAGGFAPGAGSMESHDGQLYWASTCTGGLWRIPIASLMDQRAPHERAADIVRVSDMPDDVIAEVLKGLNFRDGDDALYALDPIHLRLLRIDVTTGEREVVLDDPFLLHFPVSATFLPPVAGISPMVVVNDQEHRMAGLNASLTENAFLPPWLITKVYLRD
jgi:hypothetical protein